MRANASTARCIVATILVGFTNQSLSAQNAKNCSGATTLSATATAADVWDLTKCPQNGPQTMAGAWGRPGISRGELGSTLVEASGRMRDARVFAAVSQVAANRARASSDRVAALQVLLQYFNPKYAPTAEFVLTAQPGSPIPSRFGGAPAVEGSSPLPADVRSQIGRAFATLATSDPDTVIARAAHRIRQSLMYADPAHTPVADGAISLVAGCGARVRLRSTSDIDVQVQVRVADSGAAKTYAIRSGTSAKPGELLLALPPGVVVASYGGAEITRLSTRNGSCQPGEVRWPD